MAGFASIRFVVAAALLCIATRASTADGVVVPPAAQGAPRAGVYGTWTTPPSGAYGTWTAPAPGARTTWASPPQGAYGSWGTSGGGVPAPVRTAPVAALPTVTAPAPVYAPSAPPAPTVCEPDEAAYDVVCSPWRVGLFARYWRPEIGGEVLITRGGVPGSGSVAKLDDDLNLDTGDAFEGGLWVGYGRHRATLGYEHDPFEGTSRLTRQVIYRGTAFPAGTAIRSDVSLSIWKLGYDYAFLDGRSTGSALTLRGGIGAWLWDYDGRIRTIAPGPDERRSFSHPLPVATLAADTVFGWLHLGARASGGLLASDRYVVDVEASAGVRLWGNLGLDVGYRVMNLSFHETTNEGDMTLYGPFASVSVEF